MRELRERAGPVLKLLCLILAALVVFQLAGMVVRWNPFRGVIVPALPSLTAGTNSPAAGAHGTNLTASAAGKGTNSTRLAAGTNTATSVTNANTNSAMQKPPAETETNATVQADLVKTNLISETNVVAQMEPKLSGTNSIPATNLVDTATNVLISTNASATNAATSVTGGNTNSAMQKPPAETETNAVVQAELVKTNASSETNVVVQIETKSNGTNSIPATNSVDSATNVLISTNASGTNAAPRPKAEGKIAGAAPMPDKVGMNSNPSAPPGKRGADLPPAVQARISRITDSEILGPVIHPQPMGLTGIAGGFAFLRSASGQTGLVKEGDSLDDIKLLRIGINRVLIEQAGQKKELMIFSGYGGDSLLPTNTPDENNHP
jgi:hypothetical protein